MNITDIIKSILELSAVLFVIWGLFHEDRFIAFEERLAEHIHRRRFKIINGRGEVAVKADCRTRKSF